MTITGSASFAALANDLGKAAAEAGVLAYNATKKAGQNVKDDWVREWTGLSHAPRLAAAISYDLSVSVKGVKVEVGPDKNKPQGALGNIIEYGTAKNAPHPGGRPALEREDPRFVKAVEEIARGLL